MYRPLIGSFIFFEFCGKWRVGQVLDVSTDRQPRAVASLKLREYTAKGHQDHEGIPLTDMHFTIDEVLAKTPGLLPIGAYTAAVSTALSKLREVTELEHTFNNVITALDSLQKRVMSLEAKLDEIPRK